MTPTRIVLGITGGIAAYKAAELARLLVKAGYTVDCVLTEAATHFIGAATLQAITGRPVYQDLWDARVPNGMAHIELGRDTAALLIAPAAADFMAKLVHGRADDLLSTLCLARDCPLLIAPAMNRQMWAHPATQRNAAQLIADGVTLLGPAAGEQACGETGLGRMLEAADLFAALTAFLQPKPLAGRRVLITAGPTFEPIDPVRGLTNLSSGKMGYALAVCAHAAGAVVTLISGPTALATPWGVTRINITRADEMLAAVEAHIAACDIFIAVAAVADYRPAEPQTSKIKKTDAALTLHLTPTTDILARIAARPDAPFCVGFAAETDAVLEHASAKRLKKGLPLIVANRAQDTLGHDDAACVLIDAHGNHPLARAPKGEIATQIITHIAQLYSKG
jgi:phosphopantothenoylcysteine decarboxylase / phosphopantothenate---cysteine ligase